MILYGKLEQISTLTINGRELQSFKSIHAGDEIDISTLPAGIYMVAVQYDNEMVQQQKLIIQD